MPPERKRPAMQVRVLDLGSGAAVEEIEMGGAYFFSLFTRGPLGASTAFSVQIDDDSPDVIEMRGLESNGLMIGVPESRRDLTTGFKKVTFRTLNAQAGCTLHIVWGDVAVLARR